MQTGSATVRYMDQWTGEPLRRARKAKRLTQRALGDLVGVSGAAVGKWESGASTPSYDNAQRIGEVLAGDPPPDNLNQLRAVVEAQAQLVLLLAREARERLGGDDELSERLAALEVVLGRRRLP